MYLALIVLLANIFLPAIYRPGVNIDVTVAVCGELKSGVSVVVSDDLGGRYQTKTDDYGFARRTVPDGVERVRVVVGGLYVSDADVLPDQTRVKIVKSIPCS